MGATEEADLTPLRYQVVRCPVTGLAIVTGPWDDKVICDCWLAVKDGGVHRVKGLETATIEEFVEQEQAAIMMSAAGQFFWPGDIVTKQITPVVTGGKTFSAYNAYYHIGYQTETVAPTGLSGGGNWLPVSTLTIT